jgi:H+/Cl- antiporter ClcA
LVGKVKGGSMDKNYGSSRKGSSGDWKEGPGFLVIGLVASFFGLLWSVLKYTEGARFEIANEWLPLVLIYGLIALYFVYHCKKAAEENERCS